MYLDAAASRMLEGPLLASPVPVVRGLGHFPPADRQGRLTVARNRDRGQSGSRDHLKVFQSLQINIQDKIIDNVVSGSATCRQTRQSAAA